MSIGPEKYLCEKFKCICMYANYCGNCVRDFKFYTHVHLCTICRHTNNMDNLSNILHEVDIFFLFFQI